MLDLFLKLTSLKPEIRKQPTYYINNTVNNLPAWYQLIGNTMIYQREMMYKDEYKKKLKSAFRRALAGVNTVTFHYNDRSSVIYTFAPWEPLTSLNTLIKKYPLDIIGNSNPLLRSPNKKIGLADVCREGTGRFKSFNLSDAIYFSYYRDIRFVVYLSIFFGFTIWMHIAPDPLLNKPAALSSPDLKLIVNVIQDTYHYHICSTHPQVLSPCDCGEPLNNTVKDLFPQTSFDPLHIENNYKGKMITVAIMVATIIITLALMESVSQHGVYLPL